MKKLTFCLIALVVLAGAVFLPGCAEVQVGVNLLTNADFTNHAELSDLTISYTDPAKGASEKTVYNFDCEANKLFSGDYWTDKLPKGWTVKVSDPAVASLNFVSKKVEKTDNSGETDAEKSRNYAVLKINASAIQTGGKSLGYGWIQLSQKIKVNPDSYYDISIDYYGGLMSAPNADTGKNEGYSSLFAGVAEDPSYIPSKRVTSVSGNVSTQAWTVGSGNLRSMTLTINLGAPGHEMGGSEVMISNIRIQKRGDTPADTHIVYKNGGFRATGFKNALWIIVGFIGFVALAWFAVHFLTKNFTYNKSQEKDPHAPIGGGKGKGSPKGNGPRGNGPKTGGSKTGSIGNGSDNKNMKTQKSVKSKPKSANLLADDGGDTLEVPLPKNKAEGGENKPEAKAPQQKPAAAAETAPTPKSAAQSRAETIRAMAAAKEAAMRGNPDRVAFGFAVPEKPIVEEPSKSKPVVINAIEPSDIEKARAEEEKRRVQAEKQAAEEKRAEEKRIAEEKRAADKTAAEAKYAEEERRRAEEKQKAAAEKAADKEAKAAEKTAAKQAKAALKAERKAEKQANKLKKAEATAPEVAVEPEPVAEEIKPVEEAAVPEVAVEPEPVTEEIKPVEEVAAPEVVVEPEPVTEEIKPVEEAVAPEVVVEPEPVTEEIKPVEEVAAPEVAVEPEPVTEEIKPVEEVAAPEVAVEPEPVTEEIKPVEEAAAEVAELAVEPESVPEPKTAKTEPVVDTFDDVSAVRTAEPVADVVSEPRTVVQRSDKGFAQTVKKAAAYVWKNHTIWVLLGLALVIKLTLGLILRGARPDLVTHLQRIGTLFTSGSKYYADNPKDLAAPGQLYLYYYLALFKSWFGLTDGGAGMLFFFRLPSLIFDLATAWLLYSTAKKFISNNAGLAVAALYLFNPALILAFNIWGSFTAVWVFFLVLTLRYCLERKITKLIIAYTLAVFFAAEALTVAPLLLVYLIVLFVKSFRAYAADGSDRKGSIVWSSQKYRAVWEAPLALAVFFAGLFLICLPFTVHEVGAGKVFYYVTVFKNLCLSFKYFTYNAFGISGFTDNYKSLYSDDNPKWMWIALYFVICAIFAGIYLMKRNRANLTLLTALLFLIVAVFMPNAGPLSMVPVLILLLLAVIAVGDRRLLGQYFIFSLLSLFNIGAVMINGLYLNGLPDYMFTTSANVYFTDYAIDYTAREFLSKNLMIVGSILTALAFVYLLFVVMDITVTNKRRLFLKSAEGAPLLRSDSFLSMFK
ncbi:hypothetical protein FACS1894211_10510 [Clostridia bacterium]|nr:hypothetical protein FACS1894211_10510 [Clostridia bacterium]